MRCHWILFCLVAALAGCEREKREFHVMPPMAELVSTVQLSDLVPGSPASPSPASVPQSASNEYENNAYHLSEGQTLYENFNCVTCHAHGGGDIGPPLNDDKWIYGYEPQQVYASIVQGRQKGMPAFGTRLNQKQVWELAAYVRSLSGLTPRAASPARTDHMQTGPPPNSIEKAKPKNSTPE
jgi:cytochrome c oxidase cbb3-type subunit 3